jgi:2-polyprenyl-3-methyl-5-hydroxy-6-metoxy-1,4-benzoquinol methylase
VDDPKEAQYRDLQRIKAQVGVARLGLMSNQVWHDDPRRLVFTLARYKFVAKMLAGRRKVAEVGCGDAFGARLVLQEVAELDAYDFDRLFIEDLEARREPRWPIRGVVHDILDGPLPHAPYDAVYSLDVMEHIPAAQEHVYASHLARSLGPHGVLVVGMPSLESQVHASPQSKAGHVNCKSGPAFKAVLEAHFHNVFLFSMNDEVVHTGFAPMAHYLIGLCCEART